MILGILESLEKSSKDIQNFLINEGRNPILWIGLFVLGLVVFFLTYSALHKD